MSFNQKTYFEGTAASQKNGSHLSLYGQVMACSGYPSNDVLFYKRSSDSIWGFVGEANYAGSSEVAESMVAYKQTIMYSRSTAALRLIYILETGDDFTLSPPSSNADFTSVASSSEGFGTALSFSDRFMAVSSPEKDANQGSVYVVGKTGDSWKTVDDSLSGIVEVTPDIPLNGNYFGSSLVISNEFLVVGAKGNSNNRGAIYVFERDDETGEWLQSSKIFASDGEEGDQFGCSMSLSGDYLAVGAEFANLSDGEYVNAGAVYLFKYNSTTNKWSEIKKITGVNESDYSSNHFGHSVDINGDYLIVGSPDASGTGVADIFYKKNNWNHLQKVSSTDASTGDSFGESVGIYYPYVVIGASSTSSNVGRVYIYEEPPVRLRLAQEFDVDQEYLPTKASIYLQRVGDNDSDYWPIYPDKENVIDATNFSSITQGDNKVIFDDRITSYTGNGYMVLAPEASLDIIGNSFDIINYPIRSSEYATYQLWLRCYSNNFDNPSVANFEADILIDGEKIDTVTEVISVDSWSWIHSKIVIPDTQEHILGIKMKEKGCILDKIYIDADILASPEGEGPYNSESPYVTVHTRIFSGSGSIEPINPLFIYDYKTTIDEIIQDDWYNFNLNVLDDRFGFDSATDFSGNYFIVLCSSGSNSDNFVQWAIVDTDEYDGNPSFIKV